MQEFSGLTRRDFLKLISLMPVGVYSRSISKLTQPTITDFPNIIILVFDAWSQRHTSLYGYPRQTMPNLEKFAEKATVYHNHYSAGTFTSSGTASLLTGLYPWLHRVFHLGAAVTPGHTTQNIFSAIAQTHSTLGYSQNEYADQILYSLNGELDEHVHNWAFGLQNSNLYGAFNKNPRIAFASFEDNIIETSEGNDSSMFLGPLLRLYFLRNRAKYVEMHQDNYPIGLPNSSEMFLLEDVVDGAIQMLKGIESPTLAYFHFYPPHDPYCPTKEFYRKFADGWKAPHKPIHDLSEEKREPFDLDLNRRAYDEFLASWDSETGRLFDFLKESGLTENSYVFITADHGELFERGITGHFTKLIYDPLIHIPLIVSRPGQTSREDIHALTSSVDILPTVANLLVQTVPAWTEGHLLPRLGGVEDEHRSIFSVDAKYNSSFTPLRNYSISITRNDHRLIHYSYPKDEYEKFEFYDLNSDPDELKDLFPAKSALALEMRDELLQRIREVNQSYHR
jgi:arylsulfatase